MIPGKFTQSILAQLAERFSGNSKRSSKLTFEEWKAKYAPHDSGADYDLRGAYEDGLLPGENGHFSDKFKRPNHPTFSIESKYWRPGMPAGRWNGEEYIRMNANEAYDYVISHPDVRNGLE